VYTQTYRRKVYSRLVHKTTIEVDEELVDAASAILGTRGLKATVQRALEEVVAYDARARFVDRLQIMQGLDFDNPDVVAQAWR
jgi:Arc/MetJ family transcription regulator